MTAGPRRSKRALVSLKVRFKSTTVDDFIEQQASNISEGGIFIRSRNPMPVDTLLKFEFQLKDQSRLVQGVGKVTWVKSPGNPEGEPAGMGIKFIKMDDESRHMVEHIVQASQAVQAGGALPSSVERALDTPMFPVDEPMFPVDDGGGLQRGPNPIGGRFPGISETESSDPSVVAQFFPTSEGDDGPLDPADATQVRHAKEFLATALEGVGRAAPTSISSPSSSPSSLGPKEQRGFLEDSGRGSSRSPFGDDAEAPSPVKPAYAATLTLGEGPGAPRVASGGRGADGQNPAGGDHAHARAGEGLDAPDGDPRDAAGGPPARGRTLRLGDEMLASWSSAKGGPSSDQAGPTEGGREAWPEGRGSDVDDREVTRMRPNPGVGGTRNDPARPASAGSERGKRLVWSAVVAAVVGLLIASYFGLRTDAVQPGETGRGVGASSPAGVAAQTEEPVAMVPVDLSSDPIGAVIEVNGKEVGTTPAVVDVPAAGQTVLRVRKRGFASAERVLRASAGDMDQTPVKVVVTLAPLPYVLEVISDPTDARVRVGPHNFRSPGTVTIPSTFGEVEVIIKKARHRVETVLVTEGDFEQQNDRMYHKVEAMLEDRQALEAAERAQREEEAAARRKDRWANEAKRLLNQGRSGEAPDPEEETSSPRQKSEALGSGAGEGTSRETKADPEAADEQANPDPDPVGRTTRDSAGDEPPPSPTAP